MELGTVPWEELQPTPPYYLFVPQDIDLLSEYERGWKISEIMNLNGDPAPGIVTTHDEFAISWSKGEAQGKVERFLNTSNEEQARDIILNYAVNLNGLMTVPKKS